MGKKRSDQVPTSCRQGPKGVAAVKNRFLQFSRSLSQLQTSQHFPRDFVCENTTTFVFTSFPARCRPAAATPGPVSDCGHCGQVGHLQRCLAVSIVTCTTATLIKCDLFRYNTFYVIVLYE